MLNYKKRLFGQDSDENHGNLPTLQAAVDQETIAQVYFEFFFQILRYGGFIGPVGNSDLHLKEFIC